MQRRAFITLLGGAAAAWPLAARAQQPAMPIIGFLRDSAPEGSEHFVTAVRNGLRETGLIDGKNVGIEFAWTDGHSDRLSVLATTLVRRPVSAVLASAITATLAAKAATSTIPIIFAISNDPVASGLVKSMNRPGGNVTGVSYLSSVLGGKRLGLLRELLPAIKEVVVLLNPATQNGKIFLQDVQMAARTISVQVRVLNAVREPDIDNAFVTLSQQRADAILVVNDTLFTAQRSKIVALAAHHAVPAIYSAREFAEAGGLMSYGPSVTDAYRQAGVYAGRILKGENPADLPVMQPTKFELVVNLTTLKALGFTLPPTLFAIADEVIE